MKIKMRLTLNSIALVIFGAVMATHPLVGLGLFIGFLHPFIVDIADEAYRAHLVRKEQRELELVNEEYLNALQHGEDLA